MVDLMTFNGLREAKQVTIVFVVVSCMYMSCNISAVPTFPGA